MTKFEWITTQYQYNSLLALLNRELDECRRLPASPTLFDLYARLIGQRDALEQHGLAIGLHVRLVA